MTHGITILLRWEAGHRLSKHAGGCKHLHGHSYRAEISLEANVLNEDDMVIDFAFIKHPIRNWINENWDHSFLLNNQDPWLHQLQIMDSDALFFFDNADPTAENIAARLLTQVLVEIEKFDVTNILSVKQVKIWETETAFATARP